MNRVQPTLLGLPAELRAQILELVTFHEETGGVISPTLIDPSKNIKCTTVLINDTIWEMQQNGRPSLFQVDPSVNVWQTRAEQADERAYRLNAWDSSLNVKNGHFCKLECLIQPSIAMVNRILRQESLPLFYNRNHFHLEMLNFHAPMRSPQRQCEMLKNPSDWYRAIGSDNIKRIGRLSLGGFIREDQFDKFPHREVIEAYPDPESEHSYEGRLFRPDRKAWVDLRGAEGRECLQMLEAVVAWCIPHIGRHLSKQREGTQ